MQGYSWFLIFLVMHGFLLLAFAFNVSWLRIKHKVAYGAGDGNSKELMKAIRVHSNGTEQVPMFALLVLGLSIQNVSSTLLATLVIGFTVSRIAHAYGMMFKQFKLRQLGALFTYILQFVAVVLVAVNLI